MAPLGYSIIRYLADPYDITEEEALGLARWRWSLPLDEEF